MRGKILSHGLRAAVLAISAVALFAATAWAAASETVLHNLNNNGTAAAYPCAGLIMDASGNFYGTTCYGGLYNGGTVFELTRAQGGGWTETVLYSFGNGTDGSVPEARLIFDANGNLYGTTTFGGIHDGGTVFELTPTGGGNWTETVLRNFGGGTDGAIPFSGLVFDANGNLYGTTYQGGIHNHGTVFQLAPRQGGGWTGTVLHSFNNNGSDGALPESDVIFDAAGNLYGTTSAGGIHDYGTAFELAPAQGGGWTETVLHSFNLNGTDGAYPEASLVFDTAGNLYGTTGEGGIHYIYGTVFELTPRQGAGWTETVLHSFNFNGADGAYPEAGLTVDSTGNLYSTTSLGGIHNYGTAFELSPRQGGGWTETVLHSFNLNGTDGANPYAPLILDSAGNLYGTTYQGGVHASGTVFEITP